MYISSLRFGLRMDMWGLDESEQNSKEVNQI
jgi:hypothetical protein